MSDHITVKQCECGCQRHLDDGTAIVQIRTGIVSGRKPTEWPPVEWHNDTIYREECWNNLHPKPGEPAECPLKLAAYCVKDSRCAIWDNTSNRCAILSIALNTKRL